LKIYYQGREDLVVGLGADIEGVIEDILIGQEVVVMYIYSIKKLSHRKWWLGRTKGKSWEQTRVCVCGGNESSHGRNEGLIASPMVSIHYRHAMVEDM
jgi:hypothetical protein